MAVRSLLILMVGFGAGLTLRHRAAATRHTLYTAIVLSLLLLPAMRQWGRSVLVNTDGLPRVVRAVTGDIPGAGAVNLAHPFARGSEPSLPVGQIVILAAMGCWLAGCVLLAVRLLAQWVRIDRIVKGSRKVILPGYERCQIRVSEEVRVPVAAWLGKSTVLLPEDYESWPEDRLRSVVLHESAHTKRLDCLTQLLACLACVVYWPNPLVWVLQRRMVTLAEEAADDLVLQAGIPPSRYAEDLLQIARTVRQKGPALMFPMAANSDVGRRIEMILNTEKRRGSVHLAALAVAGLATAAITVPAANLLFQQRQADRTSPYAEIRDGKTVPGTEANGFVAVLGDGRTVELLQILWHKPDGGLQAWGPDGSAIPERNRVPAQYHGSQKGMMEFIYRLKLASAKASVCMGSGPQDVGEPPTQTFAGNWALPPEASGKALVVSLMLIPDPGASVKSSYSFTVADGQANVTANYDVVTGVISNDRSYATNITVDRGATAPLFVSDRAGDGIRNAKGEYIRNPVPAFEVDYNYPREPISLEPEVVGIATGGRLIHSIFGGGENDRDRQYFPKDKNIKRIEIRTRRLGAVEFLGVHVRPNEAPTP
ncbi:MAG: M56 family metallopeptidase [Fimbriimonadaceae bacterium]